MYRCRYCGKNIDDYQYNNYNGMCSECIRSVKTSKNVFKENMGCLGGLLIFGAIAFFFVSFIVIPTSMGSAKSSPVAVILPIWASILLLIGFLLIHNSRK